MFRLWLAIFLATFSTHGISSDLENSVHNPIESLSKDKQDSDETIEEKFSFSDIGDSVRNKKSRSKDSAKKENSKTTNFKEDKPVLNIATPERNYLRHQNGTRSKQDEQFKNLRLPLALGGAVLIGSGIALGINHLLFERSNNSNKPTFYLYTTGIGCWGNNDLMEFWQNSLRDSILAQIPDNFQVVITHYDPLMDMIQGDSRIENYDSVKQTIEDLAQDDMSNERVSASYFVPGFFQHDHVEKIHLVIDLAHLYRYTDIGKVMQMNVHEDELTIENEITLNAIYFGFLGNEENLQYRVLSLSKMIEIDSTGSVRTYIDKLIENGYRFHSIYPAEFFFRDLLNEVKTELEVNFQIPLISAIDLINETKSKHLGALVDFAVSQIWKNTPQHLLVKSLADFIVEKNNVSPLNSH